MKNKLWIAIAIAFIVLMVAAVGLYPRLAENYAAPEEPEPAEEEIEAPLVKTTEDIVIYDSDMKKIHLSDKFGKPLVVNFWASWCGPCMSELPAFETMYQKYGKDVEFVMVNLPDNAEETPDKVRNFVAERGFTFPLYYDMDMDAAITYGLYSIPQTLFINPDGSLYARYTGFMSQGMLENYISSIIGG